MKPFTDFLNTESIDTQQVCKLEDVLTEVLAKEYDTACAYVSVDKIELSYLTCEDPTDKPVITLHLRYGVTNEHDWQKEMDLFYDRSNLDFIAGQFYQALVSQEQETNNYEQERCIRFIKQLTG